MNLLNLFLIVAGFILLIKGAQFVVDTSVYVARRTGLPRFVIGVTIVAFGTSLPEMIVNLLSSFNGNNELVIGNILGSNIANILLVIGIAAAIRPIAVRKVVATRDIPFSLASVFIFIILLFDTLLGESSTDGLSRNDGLIMFMMFLIFLYYVAFSHKEHYDELEDEVTSKRFGAHALTGLLGLIMLFAGGYIIVEGSSALATAFGISQKIIGLTIVAVSTSLPELVTTIVAIQKGEGELGIGNIIGSNIFNILFILGMSVLISPISGSYAAALDIFILFVATVLLLAALYLGKRNKVDRNEGIFFLVLYGVYLVILVSQASALPLA